MFWQSRAIPTATESLDQQDRVHHAAAKKIDRRDLIGKRGGLSGGHFEVTGDAALVAGDGKIQILLSCLYCSILRLGFAFENPQRRNVVFDLLETGQDGLAIIGDGLVVRSDGLIRGSSAPSRVEDGLRGCESQRPEAAWSIQQGCDARAFESASSTQIDQRIIGGFRDSDLSIGGGYSPFGRGD